MENIRSDADTSLTTYDYVKRPGKMGNDRYIHGYFQCIITDLVSKVPRNESTTYIDNAAPHRQTPVPNHLMQNVSLHEETSLALGDIAATRTRSLTPAQLSLVFRPGPGVILG